MNIRAKLVEICDAFNAHDLDRIMRFFADDCVLEMPKGSIPYGSRFEGKHNVREGLAARFEGIPDVHYGSAEHFVDVESQTGISKWCLTGTGRDGKKVEVPGVRLHARARRAPDLRPTPASAWATFCAVGISAAMERPPLNGSHLKEF